MAPATTWRWWEELTSEEVAALDRNRAVAVLPLAAIEQHGPHLPLGTDAILCDAILSAALARLIARLPGDAALVLRLPTQRIGHSPEHIRFAGTLSVGSALLLAAWTQIGGSLAAAGLRRLVVFNTHGGQGALVDLLAQELRRRYGMLVVRANYWRFGVPDGWLPERELRYGLHGGQLETALMLHVAPGLVRRERLADFRSAAEGWEAEHPGLEVEGRTAIGWMAEDLHPQGATGDAAAASADLGARLLEHYAACLATVLAAAGTAELPRQPARD